MINVKGFEFNSLFLKNSSSFKGLIELLFINSNSDTFLFFDGIEFQLLNDNNDVSSWKDITSILDPLMTSKYRIDSIAEDQYGDIYIDLENSNLKIMSTLDFNEEITQKISLE